MDSSVNAGALQSPGRSHHSTLWRRIVPPGRFPFSTTSPFCFPFLPSLQLPSFSPLHPLIIHRHGCEDPAGSSHSPALAREGACAGWAMQRRGSPGTIGWFCYTTSRPPATGLSAFPDWPLLQSPDRRALPRPLARPAGRAGRITVAPRLPLPSTRPPGRPGRMKEASSRATEQDHDTLLRNHLSPSAYVPSPSARVRMRLQQ